jgi:hypothetical protein
VSILGRPHCASSVFLSKYCMWALWGSISWQFIVTKIILELFLSNSTFCSILFCMGKGKQIVEGKKLWLSCCRNY